MTAPYPAITFGTNTTQVCQKALPPTMTGATYHGDSDLRPDFISLMAYLDGERRAIPVNDPVNYFRAGLPRSNRFIGINFFRPDQFNNYFNSLEQSAGTNRALVGGNALAAASNDSSVVVIVSHKPPLSFEVPIIRCLVDKMQKIPLRPTTYTGCFTNTNDGFGAIGDDDDTRAYMRWFRPIIFVYIPTNPADLSQDAVSNISDAFNIPSINDPRPTGNTLFTLSPYLNIYASNDAGMFGPDPTRHIQDESENHFAYWRSLTRPDQYGRATVVTAARRFFYSQILRPPEPRF
jgi:hypothetical protein